MWTNTPSLPESVCLKLLQMIKLLPQKIAYKYVVSLFTISGQ